MTSDNGKMMQHRYKECGINYSFKPNEMKGSDLMKNLRCMTTLAGGFLVINYHVAGRKDFKK